MSKLSITKLPFVGVKSNIFPPQPFPAEKVVAILELELETASA